MANLQGFAMEAGRAERAPLVRGLGWGFGGGLVGTIVMDLLLMGVLIAVKYPAFLCFSIVGDTAARFFSMVGVQITGGVSTGAVAHYVIGPLVGLIFGAAAAIFPALREGTLKKSAVAAVVYVEILSQPLLATTPILLKMTPSVTVLWFGGSLVMHLVFGIVLGVIVSHGLRSGLPFSTRQKHAHTLMPALV
jgi:hypothetical protein